MVTVEFNIIKEWGAIKQTLNNNIVEAFQNIVPSTSPVQQLYDIKISHLLYWLWMTEWQQISTPEFKV